MWRWKVAIFICAVFHCYGSQASSYTFALLAKSINDNNFQEAWRGCQESAALNGNDCILIGPSGSANPREQLQALKSGLEQHSVDALAVSVTHSALLANFTKQLNIPIFSFDSPFSKRYSSAAQAYIGVDNHQFGKKLGMLAQQLRPNGGSLCIMSAENDPNLSLRVQGIRAQLSGAAHWPENKRLTDNSGWTESTRCPWDSGDSVKRSIRQLETTLTHIRPDLFISVGHWPVLDTQLLKSSLKKVLNAASNRRTILLAATGTPSPDQIALLNEGIFDGFVSIDFYTMGRQAADVMSESIKKGTSSAHEMRPPLTVYTKITK